MSSLKIAEILGCTSYFLLLFDQLLHYWLLCSTLCSLYDDIKYQERLKVVSLMFRRHSKNQNSKTSKIIEAEQKLWLFISCHAISYV